MRIKKGRGKGLIILNKLTILEVNLWQEKILEEIRRCVKKHTFLFYAQSPDFHKLGLCYYLKILYL